MSTTTANLGLIKPEKSDNYSVDVMAGNMDIIDARITALEAGEFESITTTGDITVGGTVNCNAINANSLIPRYTLTATQPSSYRGTVAGGSGSASLSKTGTQTPVNGQLYTNALTSGTNAYFDFVPCEIPITIRGTSGNLIAGARIYVNDELRATKANNGSIVYTLPVEDFYSTVRIELYYDAYGSGWNTGLCGYSYPTLYIV